MREHNDNCMLNPRHLGKCLVARGGAQQGSKLHEVFCGIDDDNHEGQCVTLEKVLEAAKTAGGLNPESQQDYPRAGVGLPHAYANRANLDYQEHNIGGPREAPAEVWQGELMSTSVPNSPTVEVTMENEQGISVTVRIQVPKETLPNYDEGLALADAQSHALRLYDRLKAHGE